LGALQYLARARPRDVRAPLVREGLAALALLTDDAAGSSVAQKFLFFPDRARRVH